MSDNNIEQRFRLVKKPPESGLSYLVAIGLGLTFSCTWSSTTFSLLFNDFLSNLVKETSTVAIILTGTYNGVVSIAGLLASILFKKYSSRSIGIFGSLLFLTGSLATVFVNSIGTLVISYGILQGVGVGLMTSVAYCTFNTHFVEKRMFVMTTTKFFIGLSSTIYPILVESLLINFNLRGALAVLAAINNFAVVGMLLMHPVEWRYKRVEITENDTEQLCPDDLENQVEVNGAQTSTTQEIANGSNTSDENLNRNIDTVELNERRWFNLIDYSDLALLKDLIYLNLIFGITFATASAISFITLQPLYLLSMGFSKEETALILSIGAAANLISSLSMALLSLCFHVKARYVFLTGAILTVILRIVFVKICTLIGMIVISAAIGFAHTLMTISMQLVFAEYLPLERFAFGYGFFMFVQGNLGFVIGVATGWIRDVTESYKMSFYSLAFIMSLCVVLWIIEIAWVKLFRRTTTTERHGSS